MAARIVPTIVQPPELPPPSDSTGRRRRRVVGALDPIVGAEADSAVGTDREPLQAEESRRQRRDDASSTTTTTTTRPKKIKIDDLDQYKPGPGDPSKTQIRQTFAKFDRDGSGTIDAGELELMIQAFTPGLDSSEVGGVLHRFDADGSGELSIGEFGRMLQQLRPLAAAACGQQMLRRQNAGVLIPGGTLVKPSDALKASSDPGVRVGICWPLAACLVGAAPALACLCLYYYHDAATAACSTDLGQWLLWQGGSGAATTALQLLRLVSFPKRKHKLQDAQAATLAGVQGKKVSYSGAQPAMLKTAGNGRRGSGGKPQVMYVSYGGTTFYEERPPTAADKLFDVAMASLAMVSLVWFVIGNVRLYATSACDAVPLNSSVAPDAGSGLLSNATVVFAEDGCCDAALWNAVHGYFIYTYVACGLVGLCCLAAPALLCLMCCCYACTVCCGSEETHPMPGLDDEEAQALGEGVPFFVAVQGVP